jgi:methylmalonyl-CoA mutase N-terminal domain/subunit
MDEPPFDKHLVIDESIRQRQLERLKKLSTERNSTKSQQCLDAIKKAASGDDNLMPHIITAVESHCTLGEISNAMRSVFGEYK